jgi:hypothetical protein
MTAQDTASKIKVELLNSAGQSSVYVTQTNTVTVLLTNQTGGSIAIQQGTPQNPPPPGGPFEVLLDFSAFFTSPGDQGKLQITGTGWSAQFFPGQFASWSLAANQATTWNNGDVLTFTVSNFEPTVPVGTYYLNVSLYNLNGQQPIPVSITVGVANPPNVKNKDLSQWAAIRLSSTAQVRAESDSQGQKIEDAAASGGSSLAIITKNPNEPVANNLTLQFYNLAPNQPLVPPDVPWGPHAPQFTLSFVYEAAPPGYYALTTPTNANAFQVGIQSGSGWNPPAKIGPGPQWLLTPMESNHQILGTGTSAFVEFSLDNIVTQFSAGPTLLYLQYNNIPGYNDGFLTLVIDKEYAAMSISSFQINQNPPIFNVPNEEVVYGYLNWQVNNSVMVSLSGYGPVPSKQQAFKVPIQKNEAIVLTAYDTILGAILTATINVQVSPFMSAHWLPCGAVLMWSGSIATIPPGFALCDGSKNGVPDLRDRFIIGAGGQQNPGDSGTSQHTHSLSGFITSVSTDMRADHTHGMPTNWYARNLTSGSKTGIDTNGTFNNNSQMQGAGGHQHKVTVDYSSMSSNANSGGLRPSWYALCYIMKLYP